MGSFWFYSAAAISSTSNALLTLGLIRSGSIGAAATLTTCQVILMGGIGVSRVIVNYQLLSVRPRSHERFAAGSKVQDQANERFASDVGSKATVIWVYVVFYVIGSAIAFLLARENSIASMDVALLLAGFAVAYLQDAMRVDLFSQGKPSLVALLDFVWLVPLAALLTIETLGFATLTQTQWISAWGLGAIVAVVIGLAAHPSELRLRGARTGFSKSRTATRWALSPALVPYATTAGSNLVMLALYAPPMLVNYRAASLFMFPFAVVASSVPNIYLAQSRNAPLRAKRLRVSITIAMVIAAVLVAIAYSTLPSQIVVAITGLQQAQIEPTLWPVAVGSAASAVIALLSTQLVREAKVKKSAIATTLAPLLFFLSLLLCGLLDIEFNTSLWISTFFYCVGFVVGLRWGGDAGPGTTLRAL